MHKPLGKDETPEQVASQAEDGTLNTYDGKPTRCFNRPDAAEIANGRESTAPIKVTVP